MRSRPWKEATVRERLAEMRWSLRRRGAPPRPPVFLFCTRDVDTGRVLTGHKSQSKTPEARRWRTMLRLRRRRNF
jgi:hypothetical protein